jgi:hypothetical protein
MTRRDESSSDFSPKTAARAGDKYQTHIESLP